MVNHLSAVFEISSATEDVVVNYLCAVLQT